MCTLLEPRQREVLPLMSSHQRCPLFGVVLLHPRALRAPGAGHRSAQPDGCARSRFSVSLSLSHTAKAAARSKHSGFIITSSLLALPVCEPCASAACPHIGRGRCYDQKLDVNSLVVLAHSGNRSGPTLWNNHGFVLLHLLWWIS